MSLRLARETGPGALLDVQQDGAVRALSQLFPQRLYPFPREALRSRWRDEIAYPGVNAYVVTDHGRVAGFAATRAAHARSDWRRSSGQPAWW